MWSAKTMLTALGQKSAIAEPAPHVQLAIRATLRNPQNSRKAISHSFGGPNPLGGHIRIGGPERPRRGSMSPHKQEADDMNPELPGPESARLVPERTLPDEKIEKLAAALRGEEWLIQQCQRVLEWYLKGLSAEDALDGLLRLLDGPEQRRIQEAAQTALSAVLNVTCL